MKCLEHFFMIEFLLVGNAIENDLLSPFQRGLKVCDNAQQRTFAEPFSGDLNFTFSYTIDREREHYHGGAVGAARGATDWGREGGGAR